MAISWACDFGIRLGRGAWGGCARASTGRPGTNSGASAASDPAAEPATESGADGLVSCPPNNLDPLTIGCGPPPPIVNCKLALSSSEYGVCQNHSR